MTNTEFSTFAKRLFVAFPDVWEWLNANSPDPKGTQEIWRDTLRECTLSECLHVLDDWISGKRPLFKAYERAQIALLIRQSVYFDRDKVAKRNQADAHTDTYRKTKRGEYRPLSAELPMLGDLYRKGLALRQRMLDGEITEEEMLDERKRIVEQVR